MSQDWLVGSLDEGRERERAKQEGEGLRRRRRSGRTRTRSTRKEALLAFSFAYFGLIATQMGFVCYVGWLDKT